MSLIAISDTYALLFVLPAHIEPKGISVKYHVMRHVVRPSVRPSSRLCSSHLSASLAFATSHKQPSQQSQHGLSNGKLPRDGSPTAFVRLHWTPSVSVLIRQRHQHHAITNPSEQWSVDPGHRKYRRSRPMHVEISEQIGPEAPPPHDQAG